MDTSNQAGAPMQEDAVRSNRITWGVALVMIPVAWLLAGLLWALIIGLAGVVMLLRGYRPQWFHVAFWTTDRIAITLASAGCFGVVGALYAASLYVFPLPFALKYPSVPVVSMLSKPYGHNETPNNSTYATTTKLADGKPLSLFDLFLTDFSTTFKLHSDVPVVVNGIKVQLTYQAYFDYNSKSEFVGFFIPSSDPDTYGTGVYLSGLDYPSALKHVSVKTSGGSPGQMTKQDDLVFTGRVYLYHDADLSIEQRAALIQMYRAKHLDVQFRGHDYLVIEDLARVREKKIK
jgi:hypothetical protein